MGKCARPNGAGNSKICAQWSFMEPPTVVFSTNPMMKVKLARVYIKILREENGVNQTLVDSDFLVTHSGEREMIKIYDYRIIPN